MRHVLFRRRLVSLVVGTLLSAQLHAREPVELDIPAQPLSEALRQLGTTSNTNIIFEPGMVRGMMAPSVKGNITTQEALLKLLQGTPWSFKFVDENTVSLVPANAAPADVAAAGMKTTSLMSSSAAQGAAEAAVKNARDGSISEVVVIGQYIQPITIGKVSESLRDIPQSVSVVTRQRMEDQNLRTLREALTQVTGITQLSQGPNDSVNDSYARGYQSTSFQMDGVNVSTAGINASFDLAVFDRIEVHRGAKGLFKGAGDPGISYNLVRKRALEPFQINAVVNAGSWETYRAELDVTGALTDSGRLRGRVVTAVSDADSYLDNMDNSKKLAYGTLEFDLSERTTLSVGGIWQDVDGGWSQGLPAYADGRLPDVSRSTSLIADYSRFEARNVDGFAELEHRLMNGGVFKTTVRHQERETSRGFFTTSGLAADGTILGLRHIKFGQAWGPGTAAPKPTIDTSADIFLSLPFELAGKTHNFLMGADYAESQIGSAQYWRGLVPGSYNIHTLDPGTIVESPITDPLIVNSNSTSSTDALGVYSELRIKPIKALTLIAAGRFSWHDTESFNNVTNQMGSNPDAINAEFTPYTGLIFDLNDAFSLYAIYSESFAPQGALMVTGDTLPPRIGEQYEAGIKGEFRDGLLTAHLAAYRLEDLNRILSDPFNPGFFIPAGKARSQGFETEISGQLAPGWNLTAGYAFTETEYIKASAAQTGLAFAPFTPKHNFNLWTHYRLPDHWVRGLEVGGGVRAVSEFYSLVGTVRRVGEAYTVASLMAGYRINDRYKVSINVDNLFDEKYWERVATAVTANFYGAPRSVTMTLRATF